MPIGLPLTVKGMEQNGKTAPFARAGDAIDMGITGIDPSALRCDVRPFFWLMVGHYGELELTNRHNLRPTQHWEHSVLDPVACASRSSL